MHEIKIILNVLKDIDQDCGVERIRARNEICVDEAYSVGSHPFAMLRVTSLAQLAEEHFGGFEDF